MKKFTLVAAAVAAAIAAQAQYTVDPSSSVVLNNAQGVEKVGSIILSDDAVEAFTKAGATVEDCGPTDLEGIRPLYLWAGLNADDITYPRVDMEEGGYLSYSVTGTAGWSGGGIFVKGPKAELPGLNLSWLNDDTHFHLAYMTPSGNAPASICFSILDGKEDCGSEGASLSLGDSFEGNPIVGPKASDEWQGIDMTINQIKKICTKFAPASLNAWTGNIFSWLGGNVAGTTFAFDAVYFYNLKGGAGVNDVIDNEADFVITDNTVNVAGGEGIELYNLAGQLVKSTAGTTLGINNVNGGLYIARSGNKVAKVLVK